MRARSVDVAAVELLARYGGLVHREEEPPHPTAEIQYRGKLLEVEANLLEIGSNEMSNLRKGGLEVLDTGVVGDLNEQVRRRERVRGYD